MCSVRFAAHIRRRFNLIAFSITIIFLFLSLVLSPRLQAASPIAQWQFNNDMTDASGNDHPVNPFGEPEYSTDSIEGSHSVSLDGVDDHLEIAGRVNTGFLHDAFTQRSVSIWFQAARTDGIQEIFEEGGDVKGLGLRINDGALECAMQENNTGPIIISVPFTSTIWTHVAAVFDAGDFTLYVNGETNGAENLGTGEVTSHGSGATIGAARDDDPFDAGDNTIVPVNFFEGMIDDVRIYDVPLTLDEIRELYSIAAVDAQGKLLSLWSQLKLGLPANHAIPRHRHSGER